MTTIFLALYLLAAQTFAWKQAEPGYQFRFPQDHSSHPDYRIEWWYYTGNLRAKGGEEFGYQLTFFRIGINGKPANPSRWTVRDLHAAHFALSDLRERRFYFAERLNRAGVGWAGASTDSYRVWNEDWEVRLGESGGEAGAAHGLKQPHRLRAMHKDFDIELQAREDQKPVIHGVGGISQKGANPGNGSHYYSLTRMATEGRLRVGNKTYEVTGASWMDHEFGTSFLEPGQVGWDWFSIQLDDESELMVFQLRRSDGKVDPNSSGTLVTADGRAEHLTGRDFQLKPIETWTSPTGARYPVAWEITASRKIALRVQAAFPEQEAVATRSTGVQYWEGATRITGIAGGKPVAGKGYLEMTGYTGRPMSEAMRIR